MAALIAGSGESQKRSENVLEMQGNKAEPKRNDDSYRKKYVALKRKCESIQLDNEKCLNRLYYVKKAARKMTRERRFLMSKLDKHRDGYKNATLTLPIEDDSVLQLMTMSSPIAPSFPASRGLAGLVTKTQRRKPAAAGTRRVGRPRLISEMTSRDDNNTTRPRPAGRGGKRKRMQAQNKQEKEKDPHLPKKPANAFLMFCQTERQTMQEESKDTEGGDMSHQEMTRQLAKRWNYLEADKKETYYTMYERDKDRYHKEMKQYIQSSATEPQRSTDPTPQPKTDTPTRAESATSGPSFEQLVKTEPSLESDFRSSPAREATALVTNTVVNRVTKPDITVQVKKEPKAESVVRESVIPKPKIRLQQKAPIPGDDPYDFDDD